MRRYGKDASGKIRLGFQTNEEWRIPWQAIGDTNTSVVSGAGPLAIKMTREDSIDHPDCFFIFMAQVQSGSNQVNLTVSTGFVRATPGSTVRLFNTPGGNEDVSFALGAFDWTALQSYTVGGITYTNIVRCASAGATSTYGKQGGSFRARPPSSMPADGSGSPDNALANYGGGFSVAQGIEPLVSSWNTGPGGVVQCLDVVWDTINTPTTAMAGVPFDAFFSVVDSVTGASVPGSTSGLPAPIVADGYYSPAGNNFPGNHGTVVDLGGGNYKVQGVTLNIASGFRFGVTSAILGSSGFNFPSYQLSHVATWAPLIVVVANKPNQIVMQYMPAPAPIPGILQQGGNGISGAPLQVPQGLAIAPRGRDRQRCIPMQCESGWPSGQNDVGIVDGHLCTSGEVLRFPGIAVSVADQWGNVCDFNGQAATPAIITNNAGAPSNYVGSIYGNGYSNPPTQVGVAIHNGDSTNYAIGTHLTVVYSNGWWVQGDLNTVSVAISESMPPSPVAPRLDGTTTVLPKLGTAYFDDLVVHGLSYGFQLTFSSAGLVPLVYSYAPVSRYQVTGPTKGKVGESLQYTVKLMDYQDQLMDPGGLTDPVYIYGPGFIYPPGGISPNPVSLSGGMGSFTFTPTSPGVYKFVVRGAAVNYPDANQGWLVPEVTVT